ncbi:Kef-type potassium/proton antiporter (CPA2 family) [Pontibacter ummariensis]|uniref:Kef-type potassium/proton antiporter, CPA2 family n=1 Tax=Pontibacter ummariensis TaxID=1610492 RepID=A0A239FK47_9BACT|nr:monovalent cation:proton antiporter family protein [Pontibacter ummariensis]PRY12042.1 Kef-type potassium/proton antiporter (CPA2 family) [Pontibacter ummariensis]SNS57185.1 Kef-type potassium/proton antiporter, CPA2 family [Pontibacter ummariensis]
MEIPLLSDIVIILGLAVVVILLFQRFKLPTILGFLATGVIAGPHGLSLITAMHDIEVLAEIGVILLLFIIGMEFSLRSLALIKRTVLLGGTTQVLATIGLVALVMLLLNFNTGEAFFMGFLIALSSTAIVLKLLQDKSEINTPQGRVVLGILIFQDIVVVPMMLLAPLMAGGAEDVGTALLLMALKGAFVIVFVLISARYLVPKLLYAVAKTKSQELFILCIVVICFAVAWLTSSLGLSLALGAFMAGLIISESEYSHQATSNILPFREIFTSFFFVSIGMLLDFTFMLQHLPVILLFTLLTFVLKGFVATLATRLLQYPLRISFLVGLSLFQVGEFAFILSRTGITYGLLSEETYQYFLSVSLLTMAITPFVIGYYHRIASFIEAPFSRKQEQVSLQEHQADAHSDLPALDDHIVIIGYGINGRNVAKAAKHAKIPYVIVELNAVTVKQERKLGEPIVYGDAVHGTILSHVNINKARVVVVAISDPEATKRIIATLREISDKVHIIVRTRFVQEMEENYRIGADEVIPEEFETSIEIFTRVLNKYLMPRDEIENFTDMIRSDNYDMLRSLAGRSNTVSKLGVDLPEIEVASLRVFTDDGSILNKPLIEANVRNRFNITVVAIKREEQTLLDINASTRLQQGDILYVVGKPGDVMRFNNFLKKD